MRVLRRLRLPARHDQLAHFAGAAAEAAHAVGLSDLYADRLELAVDEACANIIDHAYAGRAGEIEMEIVLLVDQALVVTLIDEGLPFALPERAAPVRPRDAADAPIGGQGLHIIRASVSEARWEPGVVLADGRRVNRLTLRRDLPPRRGGAA
ncbi:MAG: ATP-binding protein [Thermoflexales bacterium]|nr:ATP-binding protein [Thermoflexales bacterium]